MKRKWTKIAAFLLCALLTSNLFAVANGGTTLYDVIFGGITIVYDGEELNPTDANGNPVQPLIYNGTTYLPVRAVANAFGKDVAWDQASYTVTLTTPGAEDSDLNDVRLLVKGNIDSIYQGKYDPAYLELVGITRAEAEQDYLSGLDIEAEYFAHYFGIVEPDYGDTYDMLEESLQNAIVDLYDEIYSYSRYTVVDTVQYSDGTYSVRVVVYPINIMELAMDAYADYGPYVAFNEKYAGADFNAMSDAEYLAYTNEYGHVIVQLVRDQLPNLGYSDQKSIAIQVDEVNGGLDMNDDDWSRLDDYIIDYP